MGSILSVGLGSLGVSDLKKTFAMGLRLVCVCVYTYDMSNTNQTKGTKMTAEDLQKWDVIKFRTSNETRSKIGIVRRVFSECNILGEVNIFADLEIGKRRELVSFGGEFGSIKQFEYLHNMNPENWD